MIAQSSSPRTCLHQQLFPSLFFLLLFNSLFNIVSAQSKLIGTYSLLNSSINKIEVKIKKTDFKISNYENEILKCDKTISNSDKIKKLAIQKGNTEAQKIANDALLKSRDAKDKYNRLLESARKLKQQFENILISLKTQQQKVSNSNINTALSLDFSGNVAIHKNNGEQFHLDESKLFMIEEGDLITTSSNSKVDLQFLDGRGNLLLGENSKLKFNKGDSTDVIDFINGKMKIAVEKKDAFEKRMKEMYENLKEEIGSIPEDYEQFIKKMRARVQKKLEVRNRGGGGGAIRGTELVVNNSENIGTEILVLEGSVELFSKDRLKSITLNTGQKGIINLKGELIGPVGFDLKQINNWWEENE